MHSYRPTFLQESSEGLFLRCRNSTAGEPQGTLLWIHGLGESGLGFEGIAGHDRLGAWHHLVVDLPGYGKSSWPATAPDLAETADRLARWLDARSEGPVIAAGHSMGGVVALLLAERHPGRLRALVNIEGNVTEGDAVFSSRIAAQELQAFGSNGGREALLDAIYGEGVEDAALRTYFASMSLCDPRVVHRHARELVELSLQETTARRQAALELPHLYLAGVPGGAAEASLRRLKEEQVPTLRVEDCGHWPFLDRPEAFLDALLPFLEGLPEVRS